MRIQDLINHLAYKKWILLSVKQLSDILEQVELIEERDTLISDFIRILKYKNYFFVQEMTKKKEMIIRMVGDFDKAKDFVEERMKIYDQMWDGCGCKVNYYD